MDAHTADTPERVAFYERIGRDNLTPLWTSLANLVTPEPRSPCQPASWRFATIRAAMMEAGALFTAKEAELKVGSVKNLGRYAASRMACWPKRPSSTAALT